MESPISWAGHCAECQQLVVTEAIEQMSAGSGPYFERYAAGLRRYVDRLERPAEPQ